MNELEKIFNNELKFNSIDSKEDVLRVMKITYNKAIEDAKENATCNQIKNAEFYVGKAEEVLPEKFKQDGIHADVIIVDPPRKGCDERCLETMVKMLPNRIVYVSCDSATLARDLSYLCANGYELKKVRAFDNFPETVHVECVVLMTRQ